MEIPRSLLITIIASLLMGASSLLGMTLEDTQGRTIEAKEVRIFGPTRQGIAFTHNGRQFNMPISKFSKSTQKAVAKIGQKEEPPSEEDTTPEPKVSVSISSAINLEDTQGRTLEATNVRLSGQSVSFTRAGTDEEFTLPLATFSESTRGAIVEITEQEIFKTFLPVLESTDGYQPYGNFRVLDVTDKEIIYEIPERIETRKGNPFELMKSIGISTLYRDLKRAVNRKSWEQLTSIWFSLKNGEKIRVTGEEEYEISISPEGPLTIPREKASPEWEAHIKAYEIRKNELSEALKNKKPLYPMTASDQAFEQWITDWYVENFFRHPEVPMALVSQLLSDPELRIEYIDAVTFTEELKNRRAYIENLRAFYKKPAESDNLSEVRRILAEIGRKFPEQASGNTRLALALSLIYDAGAFYNTKTFRGMFYTHTQKAYLSNHLEFFEWKTDPDNIKDFVFTNEDLTIRQQTWANGTSQTPENLKWSNKKPFNSDLDYMYKLTIYGEEVSRNHPNIQKISQGAQCDGQAHVLRERLIARNVPSTYSVGKFNDSKNDAHAYTLGLTPEGVKSGGAWERSSGATIEPTNNVHIPDGIFAVQVGEEYNSPLRQKLRVKTQYASTLEAEARKEVIKDILTEHEKFAPAYILQMAEDDIPDVKFKNPLDHALFHQALVWKYAKDGNSSKAGRALYQMTREIEEPNLRLGWALQTWANIEDSEIKSSLASKLRYISPDYRNTLEFLVFRPLRDLN